MHSSHRAGDGVGGAGDDDDGAGCDDDGGGDDNGGGGDDGGGGDEDEDEDEDDEDDDGDENFAPTRCTLPQHLAEQLWCQGAPHRHLQEGLDPLCQNLEEPKTRTRMSLESPCWPPPTLPTTAPGRSTPPSFSSFSSSSFLKLLTRPSLHM